MNIFEEEFIEAIMGGLIAGSIPGGILGVISLFLNRKKQHILAMVLAFIPIFLAFMSFLLFLISVGSGYYVRIYNLS